MEQEHKADSILILVGWFLIVAGCVLYAVGWLLVDGNPDTSEASITQIREATKQIVLRNSLLWWGDRAFFAGLLCALVGAFSPSRA